MRFENLKTTHNIVLLQSLGAGWITAPAVAGLAVGIWIKLLMLPCLPASHTAFKLE